MQGILQRLAWPLPRLPYPNCIRVRSIGHSVRPSIRPSLWNTWRQLDIDYANCSRPSRRVAAASIFNGCDHPERSVAWCIARQGSQSRKESWPASPCHAAGCAIESVLCKMAPPGRVGPPRTQPQAETRSLSSRHSMSLQLP